MKSGWNGPAAITVRTLDVALGGRWMTLTRRERTMETKPVVGDKVWVIDQEIVVSGVVEVVHVRGGSTVYTMRYAPRMPEFVCPLVEPRNVFRTERDACMEMHSRCAQAADRWLKRANEAVVEPAG